MKKFSKFMLILIAIALIAGLSCALYSARTDLSNAKSTISSLTLTEGNVTENKNGGTVTVSLKRSMFFDDDKFITSSNSTGTSIESIFCSLHKNGFVEAFQGDLVRLKFSRIITVTQKNGTEKKYYLVGDYYITAS